MQGNGSNRNRSPVLAEVVALLGVWIRTGCLHSLNHADVIIRIIAPLDLPHELRGGHLITSLGIDEPQIAAGIIFVGDFNWSFHGFVVVLDEPHANQPWRYRLDAPS